ncbi:MAG: hypothetical protein ACJ77E_10795 [Gaiellaceae bacterium]
MRRLQQIVDGVVTVAIGIGAGYGLGALFVRLWAPAPTPENSSPPPEAFLFLWGAVLGFAAVVLARVLFIPWWSRRRRTAA